MSVLTDALACSSAGWAITPLSGKRPTLTAWTSQPFPRGPEIYEWFEEAGYQSFGVRGGAVSGGLFVLDLESTLVRDRGLMDRLISALRNNGAADVFASGWRDARATTPSGGAHLFMRAEGFDAPPNKRLAYQLTPNGLALLAEIRGEGGQVAAPPAPGREFIGDATYGVSVSVDVGAFNRLLAAFAELDENDVVTRRPAGARMSGVPAYADSVAGILSNALLAGDMTWLDVLEPGWRSVGYDRAGRSLWLRPDWGDKPTSAYSATGFESFEANPSPVLVVHSAAITSLPIGPEHRLTPGRVLAGCWFGGDETAAYRALETGEGLPDELHLPERVHGLLAAHSLRKHGRFTPLGDIDVEVEVAPALDDVAEGGGGMNPVMREAIVQAAARHYVELSGRDAATRALSGAKLQLPPGPYLGGEYLAVDDDPTEWAVGELLPVLGNATITAAFKSGKTTIVGDLIAAICDRRKFMGRFDVNTTGGRVALWNFELSPHQQRRWLRDLGISNVNGFAVLDLRGERMPLVTPRGEDLAVTWLAEHEVETWIIDPFARAFVGCGDENSNADVSRYLDTLDVIKQRSGVRQVVMPVHTGRPQVGASGAPVARGATRLDDWPDARWLLHRDDDTGARFFAASGRDVDVAEELVRMDANRRLTFGGPDRSGFRMLASARAVHDVVAPTGGLKRANVIDRLSAADEQWTQAEVRSGIQKAIDLGWMTDTDGVLRATPQNEGEMMEWVL